MRSRARARGNARDDGTKGLERADATKATFEDANAKDENGERNGMDVLNDSARARANEEVENEVETCEGAGEASSEGVGFADADDFVSQLFELRCIDSELQATLPTNADGRGFILRGCTSRSFKEYFNEKPTPGIPTFLKEVPRAPKLKALVMTQDIIDMPRNLTFHSACERPAPSRVVQAYADVPIKGLQIPKSQRVIWTKALHKRFIKAVDKLGGRDAVPKKIMEVMQVPGLSRENVASHLQKYRTQQLLLRHVTSQAIASPPVSTTR